jgi:hypothetical protein
MENFTNETIDTTLLPKFEEVQFSLDADYWSDGAKCVCLFFNCRPSLEYLFFNRAYLFFWLEFQLIFSFFFLVLLLSRISFNKKRFAFRTQCSFLAWILATNIIVIPYNRVQHVALHEGFISGIWIGKIEVLLQEEAQAISKSRN